MLLNEDLMNDLDKPRSKSHSQMLDFRKKLPTYKMRKGLMDMIKSSQVVVVSGETGCGKTTQLPQFILDDAISSGHGLSCKIVCTQPRRISAISVAERVAKERGEECGGSGSCGYQIRLQAKFPRQQASMLYCTTGILIQWMQSDPSLSSISHIVLDEIHERDLLSDFLITIVKRLLAKRKDLKVILMSATLNADTFSSYFNSCPSVNIPGFTYAVQEFYLEEVVKMTKYQPSEDVYYSLKRLQMKYDRLIMRRLDFAEKRKLQEEREDYQRELLAYEVELANQNFSQHDSHAICALDAYLQQKLDFDLMIATVKHIILNPAYSSTGGAMLLFLPGWSDIKQLHQMISNDRFFQPSKFRILPLHSMVPSSNQQQVFDRPPVGVTKIVIATNIAETSITIDDIVHVIDCGKIKIRKFEAGKNISSLNAEWVTRANAKQRKGRAGRVQEGYCYHLFSKLQERKLDDYMVPEILRSPLDQLCLHIKILNLGKLRDFLSEVIEPPPADSVELSIQKLTAMNALDSNERLTPLGYHLARFPVEPQIGKMLILATMFSCLDPVLTIAASLSFKDPFTLPLGKEDEANERKQELSNGANSDHIMLVNMFDGWVAAKRRGAERDYCWRNFLSMSTVKMLSDMREQFKNHLFEAGFLSCQTDLSEANRHSKNIRIIQAIVCAGLYPNVAKLVKMKPHRPPKISTKTERKVAIHPKSVNCDKPSSNFTHQWLCYYEKMKTAEVYLYDTSEVSPYPLLFFGGDISTFQDEDGVNKISVDEWIDFRSESKVAETVKKLRKELDNILERKIREPFSTLLHLSSSASVIKSIIDLISCE
ncbi:ATP-dependent DNA/RNA helicase DHX36 [Ciona intestinalis]